MDKTVTGIGQCGLTIGREQFADLCGIPVPFFQEVRAIGILLNVTLNLAVALKQLDGEITLGNAGWYIGILSQGMSDILDPSFQ